MMNKNTVDSINHLCFNIQTCCFIVFLCLFAACSREVEADFYIDGKPFVSSVEEPRDTAMFQAEPGNDLRLRDMSEPLKSITDRSWKIESPNLGVITNDSAGSLVLPLTEADVITVTLCVNQSTSCATKWVRVAGDIYYNDEGSDPEIKFTMPFETFSESSTRTRTLKLETKNVLSADELEIKMNGMPVAFDFDANENVVSASVRLDRGDNVIEAKATVEDIISGESKSVSQEVHIDYRSRSGGSTASKPKEEPTYRTPSVTKDKPRTAPAKSVPFFDLAPRTAEVGQPVRFVNQSTNTSQARIYFWDFGDGGRSQETAPTHQYKQAGRYEAKLCINGPDNCIRKNINVFDVKKTPPVVSAPPKPVVSFSFSNSSAKVGDEIVFRNETTNTGQVENYFWDFGDGTSSTAPSPRHSYSKAGTFTVRLCVNNRELCFPKTVVVEAAAEVDFRCNQRKTISSKSTCLAGAQEFSTNMTATISPKVDILLRSFMVETKTSGQLNFEYSEGGQRLQRITRNVNAGENGSMDIEGPILKKGKTYTLKLTGNQLDGNSPLEFKYAPSCKDINSDQLNVKFSQGATFFDLKYCFL